MIAAWGTFSVIDTSAKFLVMAAIPAVQVAFMRYAVQFLFTVIEGSGDGISVIRTLDRSTLTLLILRGLILVVSTFFNFIAVKYLSLTMTSAIMFSSPIFVALLSILFLGERVGIWRWSAIIIGFIGVLIIIRPGFLEINFASISAIGAGTAYAFYIIYTRKLSFIDSPIVTLLFTGVVGCILISIILPFYWTNLDMRQLILLIC